jgi:hypothetical protein
VVSADAHGHTPSHCLLCGANRQVEFAVRELLPGQAMLVSTWENWPPGRIAQATAQLFEAAEAPASA